MLNLDDEKMTYLVNFLKDCFPVVSIDKKDDQYIDYDVSDKYFAVQRSAHNSLTASKMERGIKSKEYE